MPDPPAENDDLVGRVVDGRFRLQRRLGAGGMGAVYLAEQLNLRRQVAVKVLRPGILDEAFRVRFRAEAMATSRLNHPNIVTVHDFGLDSTGPVQLPYLVLEKLDGQDLRGILSARGRLNAIETIAVLSGIAAGLGAAHAAGIIHRDLKPENVFLVGRPDGIVAGNVKILDFGIARIFDTEAQHTATASGVVVGTPGYVPPERLLGATGDARADLYALGVMAWEICAGRPPFDAPTAMALAVKHMMDPVPSLHDVPGVRVPDAFAQLVLGLLAKSPDERPDNAAVVLEALRSMGAVSSTSMTPLPASPNSSLPQAAPAPRGSSPSTIAPTLPTPSPLQPTVGISNPPQTAQGASVRSRRRRLMGAVAAVSALGVVAPVAWQVATHGSGGTVSARVDEARTLWLHRSSAAACQKLAELERPEGATEAMTTEHIDAALWGALLCTQDQDRALQSLVAVNRAAPTLDPARRALATLAELRLRDAVDPGLMRERLAAAVKEMPHDVVLRRLMAVAEKEAGDPAAAEVLLRGLIREDPTLVDDARLLSVLLRERDAIDEAWGVQEDCLANNPTDTPCLVERAKLLAITGRCNELEAQMRTTLKRIQPDAVTRRIAAIWLVDALLAQHGPADGYGDILAEYHRQGDADARADAHEDAVMLAVWQGEFAVALAEVERWRAETPPDEAGWLMWIAAIEARVAIEVGDTDRAARVANEAASVLSPKFRTTISGERLPLHALRFMAGAVTEAELRSASASARAIPVGRLMPNAAFRRWAVVDAAVAVTPTLAREAVSRAPAADATLGARSIDIELWAGRAFVLAGEAARAVPLLKAATARCEGLSSTFATIDSRYWLGRALADVGDVKGARAAFQWVTTTWGKATPSSATAQAAADALAALPE